MSPPNQPGANVTPPRRAGFDGLGMAMWCIAGAAVGGVLGSFSPSLTGVAGCAVYLMRRSGRSVTAVGFVVDAVTLLFCAMLAIWGLRDMDLLERWQLLPRLPMPSQVVWVILLRGLAGALGGLVVGAAIGFLGRRPHYGPS
jgi:hypothetical protein